MTRGLSYIFTPRVTRAKGPRVTRAKGVVSRLSYTFKALGSFSFPRVTRAKGPRVTRANFL